MSSTRKLANDPHTSSWTSGLRSTLRAYARTHLPEAMVPAHFVVLPELPKLPNGKVDRNSLPGLDADEPGTEFVAPRSTVETRLARIWQDVLGLPRVGVESSFFDLGGDSLTVLQMASQVRDAYDVRIDLRRMFEEPTVARLARMVSSEADADITGAGNPRGVSDEELIADAVLPDDVRPEDGALPATDGPYGTVLLTGGTGYTGAFLLRQLLDRSNATVYVLARTTDGQQAEERVLASLAEYGVRADGDEDRIVGVAGDTGLPYLGLDRATYHELAATVEMIIHNAAISSWIVPYPQIKVVNVFGALEVLRLAGKKRVKPVHFISTIGVYPVHLRGEQTWEESELTSPEDVTGGYRQSKWVADSLMTAARERGIPAHVYRPGAITGSQTTGACATDTFINHLIKGCIQLGACLDYDLLLDLVPVDFCAASVVHSALGGTKDEAVFNIPAANSMSMNDLFDLVVDYGYPIRRLDYVDWHRELVAAIERGEENELAPYLPLFGDDRPADEVGYEGSKPIFDVANLRSVLDGSGIENHPVDRKLFDVYLDYFVSIGYLPAPVDGVSNSQGSPAMTSTAIPDFPLPRAHPLDLPPAYRELTADRSVFQVRMPDGQLVWLVTSHEDVRAVLKDLRFASDPQVDGYPSYIAGDGPLPAGFFLYQDPPDHTRLRRLVTRDFMISEMEAHRPRMEAILDGLIDDMTRQGSSGDLVRQLALPMAATVMCELLNVPYEDHAVFVPLADTILDRSSSPEESEKAAHGLMGYFDNLVREKEQNPTDDMLGKLVAHENAGLLTHDEFVGMAAVILLSGYDTLVQTIGLGVATLLEHPDQVADLKADPSLFPTAVEELLRYLSINHAGLPRAALEDVEVGGQLIRKGEGVLVMLNTANRDATVFEDPDRFDIHREGPQRHVAFGHGFHKCIGLTLARVELSAVFAGLFKRLPDLRLAEPLEGLPFRHDMVIYGVRRLPVQW